MDTRFAQTTEVASTQFGAVSIQQLDRMGVDRSLRYQWVRRGLLQRVGAQSLAIAGSPDSWHREAWARAADFDGVGFLAGRTAGRLHQLDGFDEGSMEVLVERSHRGSRAGARVSSTSLPLSRADTVIIEGIRCLSAERLILDGPLFDFSRHEIENAIDSALRLRLVSEQRLRTRVVDRHRQGINGGRALLDALVDTGGESRLERWFLAAVRDPACLDLSCRSPGAPEPEPSRGSTPSSPAISSSNWQGTGLTPAERNCSATSNAAPS